MENFQGDLTDVVRAGSSITTSTPAAVVQNPWPPSDQHLPLDFPSSSSSSDGQNSFGDPFLNVGGDPLLHNIAFVESKIFEGNNNNNNIFPRVEISQDNIIIQESSSSPCNSPGMAVSRSSPVGPINANVMSPNICNKLQISPPPSISLKRRKNQAKKVVCIPAPAAANSKTSGEVVPSDLWAWRKYGQKPIKGSPYPRGYYRCSSSKGCSARKQVERSRSDPKTLVITYTSEHNHPWPTQRNALAGSTRSNPTKTPTSSNTSVSPRGSQPKEEAFRIKEEMEEQIKVEPKMKEEMYMPDFQPSDDFFADLDQLEGDDSLSLLLSQGPEKQGIDPLGNFFDWLDDDKIDSKTGYA